ncbi:hypothetical protein ACRYI5_02115 [Furfurilactobacillus sp. WILCCON 0119]
MTSTDHSRWRSIILTTGLIFLSTIILTLPAFLHVPFKLSWDGSIHLSRIESISQAFHHGQLPPLVSFIGLDQALTAVSGMYPWLTLLLFAVPRFFIANPVHAWVAGLFLLNFLTGITAYCLARSLTTNRIYRWAGMSVYLFNGYHLILLYARSSLGEALAYAFFPIVLLGCWTIWQHNRRGWLWLALGMGAIANSHVLSLFATVLLVALAEIWRLFHRQVHLAEVCQFGLAAVLSGLSASLALANIVTLSLQNKILPPSSYTVAALPTTVFNSLINNSIYENAYAWSLGLICTIALIWLVYRALTTKTGTSLRWPKWSLATGGVVVLTFSWWPWFLLRHTIFAQFQFVGRALGLAALLLTVALLTYWIENKTPVKPILIFTSILMILAVVSVFQYERDYSNPSNLDAGKTPFTVNAYSEIINHKNANASDYKPAVIHHGTKKSALKCSKGVTIRHYHSSFNQITYQITSNRSQNANLMIAKYRGVPYDITVNGHAQRSQEPHNMKLALKKGNNQVTISSHAPRSQTLFFALSCGAIFLNLLGLAVAFLRK